MGSVRTKSEVTTMRRTVFLGTRTCEAESTSFSQWAPSDIVILQAIGRAHPRDPSKIPVSFEASRGLLARESHVFSDMFHFPQPGIKSESTEQTTPTIEVFDDAEELEKFLEVVHDYRVYFESDSWKDLASVAAILRLSSKYQVGHLRRRMVEHLEATYYPTTFDAYKALSAPEVPAAQHMSAIQLLTETNVQRLLPAAFFSCLAATKGQYDKLYDEVVPSDRTTALWVEEHKIKERCMRAGFLFDEDTHTHLRDFGRLSGRVHGFAVATSDRGLTCEMNSYRWFTDTMSVRRRKELRVRVDYLQQAVGRLQGQKICATCNKEADKVLAENDTKTWSRLPSFFQLPSWEELLAEEGSDADA